MASVKVRLVFRYHAAAYGMLDVVNRLHAHSETRL